MDSARFKDILLPLSSKLYRIAYSIVGDEEIAKDMVQETFISLWNKRNTLDSLDNIEAYAIKVIKNKCIDHLHTRRVLVDIDEGFNEIVADSTETDARVVRKEQVNQLQHIITKLPKRYRTILVMRAIYGYSLEDIENITGLSGVNVRTLLSRARKKLKELCNNFDF